MPVILFVWDLCENDHMLLGMDGDYKCYGKLTNVSCPMKLF